MRKSAEVWKRYMELLSHHKLSEWKDLWLTDGRFEVKFAKLGVDVEAYENREEIYKLVGGAPDEVVCFSITEDKIFDTNDNDGLFFVTCQFTAVTVSDYLYSTPMVLKVELAGEKIKSIIEYADPRKREAFMTEIRKIRDTNKARAIRRQQQM